MGSNPPFITYQGTNYFTAGNLKLATDQMATHTHDPPNYSGPGNPATGFMAYITSDPNTNVQTGGNGLNVNISIVVNFM